METTKRQPLYSRKPSITMMVNPATGTPERVDLNSSDGILVGAAVLNRRVNAAIEEVHDSAILDSIVMLDENLALALANNVELVVSDELVRIYSSTRENIGKIYSDTSNKADLKTFDKPLFSNFMNPVIAAKTQIVGLENEKLVQVIKKNAEAINNLGPNPDFIDKEPLVTVQRFFTKIILDAQSTSNKVDVLALAVANNMDSLEKLGYTQTPLNEELHSFKNINREDGLLSLLDNLPRSKVAGSIKDNSHSHKVDDLPVMDISGSMFFYNRITATQETVNLHCDSGILKAVEFLGAHVQYALGNPDCASDILAAISIDEKIGMALSNVKELSISQNLLNAYLQIADKLDVVYKNERELSYLNTDGKPLFSKLISSAVDTQNGIDPSNNTLSLINKLQDNLELIKGFSSDTCITERKSIELSSRYISDQLEHQSPKDITSTNLKHLAKSLSQYLDNDHVPMNSRLAVVCALERTNSQLETRQSLDKDSGLTHP